MYIVNKGYEFQVINVNSDENVTLEPKEKNIWETWQLTTDGSDTPIRSNAADLALDCDGDDVTSNPYGASNPYQKWRVQKSPDDSSLYLIVHVESSLYLDANDGESLKVRAHNADNPYQLWSFEPGNG